MPSTEVLPQPSVEEILGWEDKHNGAGRRPLRGETSTTPATSLQPTGKRIVRRKASDLRFKRVQWLWDRRLPLGKFGILFGKEGLGKTQIWAHWVSLLSTGRMDGCEYGNPVRSLVCATEDDWESVLGPRLYAANADMDYIEHIAAEEDGDSASIYLPGDVGELAYVIRDSDARLLILDPLLSRIDPSLDANNAKEVASALEPLVSVAQETDCTIVGLSHPNKSVTQEMSDRLLGSRAFSSIPRFVFYTGYVDDGGHDRALGQTKNQYADKNWTQMYHIEEAEAPDPEGGPPLETSVFVPDHIVFKNVVEVCNGAYHEKQVTPCTEWLEGYLVKQGGTALYADIEAADEKEHKFGRGKLGTAKKTLNIKSAKQGFQGGYRWTLPDYTNGVPMNMEPGEAMLDVSFVQVGGQPSKEHKEHKEVTLQGPNSEVGGGEV